MVLENRGAETLVTPQKNGQLNVDFETFAEVTFGVHDFASTASRSRQVPNLCVLPMSCQCRADVFPWVQSVQFLNVSNFATKSLKGFKGLRRTTTC